MFVALGSRLSFTFRSNDESDETPLLHATGRFMPLDAWHYNRNSATSAAPPHDDRPLRETINIANGNYRQRA